MLPTRAQLEAGEVHLWFLDEAPVAGADRWLDEGERRRAAALLGAERRAQWIGIHALVRGALSNYAPEIAPEAWRYAVGPHGRPSIANPGAPDLRFSLSHADGLAGVAITLGREVGFDVEEVARAGNLRALARRFFAPAEIEALEPVSDADYPPRFAAIWTLKEAYVKARSLGLQLSLRSFAFSLGQAPRPRIAFSPGADNDFRRWEFAAWSPDRDHCAAVAVESPGESLVIRCFSSSAIPARAGPRFAPELGPRLC